MALLHMNEVRSQLHTVITKTAPYNENRILREENINCFDGISRENLEYGKLERRILLYESQFHEKVYIQYPGLESTRKDDLFRPNDFRPVLIKPDGNQIPDMDFHIIWDKIDRLGGLYSAELDILAIIFLRIAYMKNYMHNDNKPYLCETIDSSSKTVIDSSNIVLTWNSLFFHPDIIETLNDRLGMLDDISFEAFLYYNDLLSQNEDCKYYFRSKNKASGRVNNMLSHLSIISHLQGNIGISKLMDRFQRTGIGPARLSELETICGSLIEIK